MAITPVDERSLRPAEPSDRLGLTILITTSVAVYARLYYGLDFTDESFYVALPYSFTLGHRPLVDELAAHQFAGLLLLPAVKAYLAIVGSNEGLVLFARHLYFALSCLCAWIARDTLSAIFGRRAGNLAAAFSLVYVPFALPSLSYNSLASLGILAGSMLLACACLPGRSPLRLGFGVVAVAIASFAYPPAFVAATVALLIGLGSFLVVRESDSRRVAMVTVITTGLAAALLGLLTIHHHGGIAALQRLAELNDAFALQGGDFQKLNAILWEINHQKLYLVALFTLFLAMFLGMKWIPNSFLAVAGALLVAPALLAIEVLHEDFREPYSTAPFVVIALGLMAPIALRLIHQRLERSALAALLVIVLPSLLFAVVILWASANGLRNAALGCLPASLVALCCVSMLRPDRASRDLPSPVGSRVMTALAVSLLCFQTFQLWTHVYRDHPVSDLTARIESGAWKGIHTTRQKKFFVARLQRAIARERGDAKTILFMDYFPAGYLLSDLRPRTPAIWLFPWNTQQQGNKAIREIYARHFPDQQSLPDMLVRMSCIPAHENMRIALRPDDPLAERLRAGQYEHVDQQDCYGMLRKGTGG
jgi:hypothetical protein